MAPRRLEPQQRREQLLDVGAAMFAERPYDDVLMEDIAVRAGVSRGTLYRYYSNKRELYIAIFKRASDRFLARISPNPQSPLAEQLATALEAHIQCFVDHPFEAITINRGALSDDPAIQAIVAEELDVVGQCLVDRLVAEGSLRDVAEVAVEGWLAFVGAACVEWVQSQKLTRADLTEMCLRAFSCALEYPDTPHARAQELTDKRLRRGAFNSVAELVTTITTGAEHRNRIPRSFVLMATVDDILAKVQRGRNTLHQIKSKTDHKDGPRRRTTRRGSDHAR